MLEPMTNPVAAVWPILHYEDAPAAIDFLVEAFGFTEPFVVPGEKEGTVAHSQLRWPLGGGVMLSSYDPDGNEFARLPVGVSPVYVVTDEPDELFARATAAGATVVRGLVDEDYGSRGFTVRDPEGNLWSFGTYRGE
jgi:uncharacterized glyoxalase superfamily protein PhnB